jgi:hypothetical protein
LGNAVITGRITVIGGENGMLVITEWCEFGIGGAITNIAGEVTLYTAYEWDGALQKWVAGDGGGNQPVGPNFPWGNVNAEFGIRNAEQKETEKTEADDVEAGDGEKSDEGETPGEAGDEITMADNPFEDIDEGDWYYADVMYAYANGLMVGTSTEPMLFAPNVTLSRAMVVTVLHRAAGSPNADGLPNPFDDVAEGAWYTEAESEFADRDEISGYAREAVAALVARGVILGRPGNIFDPQGRATRAEFAAILHRFLGAP